MPRACHTASHFRGAETLAASRFRRAPTGGCIAQLDPGSRDYVPRPTAVTVWRERKDIGTRCCRGPYVRPAFTLIALSRFFSARS